jgi:hypothetical protein
VQELVAAAAACGYESDEMDELFISADMVRTSSPDVIPLTLVTALISTVDAKPAPAV